MEKIAIAIYTANQWSSDQSGNGLAMLSFGTTRTIHSEEHRQQSIKEIENNIAWCKDHKFLGDEEWDTNPEVEIPRLNDLLELVKSAEVKNPVISYEDYFRITEDLYKNNKL